MLGLKSISKTFQSQDLVYRLKSRLLGILNLVMIGVFSIGFVVGLLMSTVGTSNYLIPLIIPILAFSQFRLIKGAYKTASWTSLGGVLLPSILGGFIDNQYDASVFTSSTQTALLVLIIAGLIMARRKHIIIFAGILFLGYLARVATAVVKGIELSDPAISSAVMNGVFQIPLAAILLALFIGVFEKVVDDIRASLALVDGKQK
jgi:hypothetical protein